MSTCDGRDCSGSRERDIERLVEGRDAARVEVKQLQRALRIAKDAEIVLRAEVRHHIASSEAFEEQVIRADKAEAHVERVKELAAHRSESIDRLMAENERLTSRNKELERRVVLHQGVSEALGEMFDDVQRRVMEVTNSQDLTGEDPDGDWEVMLERLAALHRKEGHGTQ